MQWIYNNLIAFATLNLELAFIISIFDYYQFPYSYNINISQFN